MSETLKLLDELASGEDEFDVDLMACGCRLVGQPGEKLENAVTLRDFMRKMPGLGTRSLERLVEVLVEEHGISDKDFLKAVDKAVGRRGGQQK